MGDAKHQSQKGHKLHLNKNLTILDSYRHELSGARLILACNEEHDESLFIIAWVAPWQKTIKNYNSFKSELAALTAFSRDKATQPPITTEIARDWQHSKVSNWEQKFVDKNDAKLSIQQIENVIRLISKDFNLPHEIKLQHSKNLKANIATYDHKIRTITFGNISRLGDILHEMSHCIDADINGNNQGNWSDHGPSFMRTYLVLLDKYKHWDTLKYLENSARKAGVRIAAASSLPHLPEPEVIHSPHDHPHSLAVKTKLHLERDLTILKEIQHECSGARLIAAKINDGALDSTSGYIVEWIAPWQKTISSNHLLLDESYALRIFQEKEQKGVPFMPSLCRDWQRKKVKDWKKKAENKQSPDLTTEEIKNIVEKLSHDFGLAAAPTVEINKKIECGVCYNEAEQKIELTRPRLDHLLQGLAFHFDAFVNNNMNGHWADHNPGFVRTLLKLIELTEPERNCAALEKDASDTGIMIAPQSILPCPHVTP